MTLAVAGAIVRKNQLCCRGSVCIEVKIPVKRYRFNVVVRWKCLKCDRVDKVCSVLRHDYINSACCLISILASEAVLGSDAAGNAENDSSLGLT